MKIYASDLNSYSFCPRTIYLSRALGLKPEATDERIRGLVEHAVRKELSIRHHRILGRINELGEIKGKIIDEISSIFRDFPFIYRDIASAEGFDYSKCLSELHKDLVNEADYIAESFSFMVDELGVEETIQKVSPWRTEYYVYSESLGISGRIDKIMLSDGNYIPVEVKTGKPPTNVWRGDCLQVGCYAMLLEEYLGLHEIRHCFIEYTRALENRPVIVSERLRREVLKVRDDVIAIIEGVIPEVSFSSESNKCRSCSFRGVCCTK